MQRGTIGRFAAAAGLLSLWLTPAFAQSGTSRNQLAAASNDSILWLIVGEWNGTEKTYLNWLSYLDKSSAQIHPVIRLHPQKGRVIRTAVVGESLHIFYESGAHHRYTRTSGRPKLRLPDHVIPEAIAGESTGKLPRLWAVVRNDTAQKVAAAWESQQAATQPDAGPDTATKPATRPILVNLDPDSYDLISYNGSEWEPGFAAAPGTAGSERLWLCVAGGRFHLFWQKTKQDGNVNYAWYENGQWIAGPMIPLSRPPQDATANVINRQLVFTALLPDHDDPQQLRCETWLRQAGLSEKTQSAFWNQLPGAKSEDGDILLLPAGSAAIPFADNNLAVLRMGEKDAEIGLWPLTRGGAPDQPFRTIPIRKKSGEAESPRGVREFATTLIVAMILLLVFWRRQGNFSLSVTLPTEFMIARPGKRALAALIDLAPAAVIVAWWWHAPITQFMEEVNRVPEQIEAWPQEFFWAGVTFRVIYTMYCMILELLWSKTPGKWVMGCSVWSESLTPPTPLQVAIRNLTRLIEFEPHLLIWPFMLVIFFTRDRQRIGDLLARTIVVEKNPIMADLVESGSETKSRDERLQ